MAQPGLVGPVPDAVLASLIADDPLRCFQVGTSDLNALYSWEGAGDQRTSRTLLHLAAMFSAPNVAEALLAGGANPDYPSPHDGQTAIHCACAVPPSAKGARVVALLLSHGGGKDIPHPASSNSQRREGRGEREKKRYQCDDFRMFSFKVTSAARVQLGPGFCATEFKSIDPSCDDRFHLPSPPARSRLVPACPRCTTGWSVPTSTQVSFCLPLPLLTAASRRPLLPCCSPNPLPSLSPLNANITGEKARRRDPRVFPYQAIPCPEFRKGNCKRGDGCPFAHGVFECWLHPARYRTQLCKEGTACNRAICFFAHTVAQLRDPSTPAAQPAPSLVLGGAHVGRLLSLSRPCAAAKPGEGSMSPGSPGSTLAYGCSAPSCGTSRCVSPGAAAGGEAAARHVRTQGASCLLASPSLNTTAHFFPAH